MKQLKFYAVVVLIIIAVIGLGMATYFIYDYGRNECVVAQQAEAIKQVEAARKDEQAKQEAINDDLQRQINEKNNINTGLLADIKRLQHRESRGHLPESAKANCKGATGADLSAEDAEFLVREAARADELRLALGVCYDYADTVASK